ncbi:ThuA domain-containing protein [Maritimibacter sp. UBA3975]|uniref:ThuA domain-containing protein n=1 Tax=Maritimibacter sp. UBA3975 TaxID=1946833 RepID=UPI000C0B7EB2|nr:ThuA domain-containing protein [Maritimibacter sp. UBA3975]MAM61330.1 trehalose utilization [Maritimibacter sp.]|tara:strand:- start:2285 stop:3028 length:744 start_codon:yes stop_codon:yes gene_type:complete
MTHPPRCEALLITGGPYHDMDHARHALLGFMAERERMRVTVRDQYDPAAIDAAEVIVTYTCDRVPDEAGLDALEAFVARGGRWFALHGTNSRMVLNGDDPVVCPPLPERFLALLGSQFAAHPAPGRFKVKPAMPDALTDGVGAFFVEDEQYLQHHLPGNEVLLTTTFEGETLLFDTRDWPRAEHQVMYRRPHGAGAVLYLTLGHTRGRYDMRPVTEFYPFVERGSWDHPVYHRLIRRGLAWTMRETT